jgi:anthranilate synthase component 1
MRRYLPCAKDLSALAAGGNTLPVYVQLLADNLTPVTAFARLTERAEHAFLLESVVGQETTARYSFLAAEPYAIIEGRDQRVCVRDAASNLVNEIATRDPLAAVEAQLARHRAVRLPRLPRFLGGAVGYIGYDVVRQYEPLPHPPADDRGLPDLLLGLYDSLVIFDHVGKRILVVSHAHLDRDPPPVAYEKATKRIDRLVQALSEPRLTETVEIGPDGQPGLKFSSNLARPAFEAAVEGCQEHIRAGDIFQVVLSQRLRMETTADPFDIYRAQRVINPSPFMFYLKSPQAILVGASPEIMCRVEDGIVTNRPLAGTRRRGQTDQEDRALEQELLADPKERAEHVMLVDLGRNDVGRVAEPGSVELADLMTVERYSHVMHISSTVRGRLAKGRSAVDALRATLPVGTVSGAPKVRAMQIIDAFEPTRRGPYGGAVGYIDFAGNMDTCIALRTLVMRPVGDGRYVVDAQVGAGIVADSVPAREYEETINKAKAMLRAIEIAEQGFA